MNDFYSNTREICIAKNEVLDKTSKLKQGGKAIKPIVIKEILQHYR